MGPRASLSLLLLAAVAGCARPPPREEPARLAAASSAPSAASPAPDPSAPSAPAADPFTASVRPILAKSCAPCHEPQGKMYDKLPFDNASVVASHPGGVLKRLKGSEKETVERWLTSLPEELRAGPPH